MSEVKIKPLGKIIALILIVGVAFGLYRLVTGNGPSDGNPFAGIIPSAPNRESMTPLKADLPSINNVPAPKSIENLVVPSSQPDSATTKIRVLHWAWNAHLGLLFANGGKTTTAGSLIAQRDIQIDFTRQDDVTKMQEGLIEFATELSRGNAQPKRGAHFVTIMGDGGAAFLAGLNEQLAKLGPEYKAKIVGAIGFSRGEDKFMGPESWSTNPAASKGGVVSGYLRDGDWNIAMKWLGDNGLKNNPDEKTYDPDALNWVAANDYIDAAEKYITGYTETRPVVRNGKKTGETKKISVDGVVTWTPGDVNIADKKGGLVSIVSTKEYNAQMPCVVIGIDKWMANNKETVAKILDASLIGGDAVRSSSQALRKAAEIAAEAFGEQDASYWERYYKGVIEKDATGKDVELGGSSVNNLADNMLLFGLVPGSSDIFASVYKVFGDIVKQQYPDLMPSYPPASEIVDKQYLKMVAKMQSFNPNQPMGTELDPGTTAQNAPAGPTKQIGSRAYNIQFETGSAQFKPQTIAVLEKLISDLSISTVTSIEIHGHTDNIGDTNANQALSEARAFAVQSWLKKKAARLFPDGRVNVVAHGESQPLKPNTSEAGRAVNRRVEVKVKAAQ
jgi:outer membrane protein OmpA-like peptidoglycan-associated protein